MLRPRGQENTAATVLTLWRDRQRDLAGPGQCPQRHVPASPGPCRTGSFLAPPTAQIRARSPGPLLLLIAREWLVALGGGNAGWQPNSRSIPGYTGDRAHRPRRALPGSAAGPGLDNRG